jgi:hypothetical protein
VIDGFRRAFDKKGLFFKKRGVKLQLTVKQPLNLKGEENIAVILAKVMDSIGQSTKFENREV